MAGRATFSRRRNRSTWGVKNIHVVIVFKLIDGQKLTKNEDQIHLGLFTVFLEFFPNCLRQQRLFEIGSCLPLSG